MKEKETGAKLVMVRTRVLIGIFAAVLFLFFVILYDTQYLNGQEYLDRANYSVARTETINASRGEILDTRGQVLVSNETTYQVTLETSLMGSAKNRALTLAALLELCREQGQNWTDTLPLTDSPPYAYTLDTSSSSEITRLRKLTAIYGWDDWVHTTVPGGVDEISGELLPDSDNWTPTITAELLLQNLRTQYKLDEYLPDLTDREARDLIGVLYELDLRTREVTYTEYVFARAVDITFITLVKEQKLSGVSIDAVSTRRYHTTSASHILGRVGDITSAQWEGSETTVGYRDLVGYAYNDQVGQSGVELAFEQYLHGTSGTRAIETDSTGKITNESWISEPQPGNNVVLTINDSLQAAVTEALANHIEGLEESSGGSAVMVDMTGGVLAMVSYPSFDLSTYSQDFNQLVSDPLKPLYNRATMGTYMPGSIFKMVTGLAALEEGIIEPNTKIRTTGVFTGYTSNTAQAPKCWIYRQYGGNHGLINITQAIRDSCNYFFYELSYRMGIDTLGQYAKLLGLGQSTGIEIPENTGYVAGPETSAQLGVEWYEGATTSAAIGQENNLFTPLQLANYVATLVNGGTHYSAHLLKSVKSSDYGQVIYEYEPEIIDQINIAPENLAVLKEGMYQVTQTSSIAQYFNALPVKAGAKTGTAQVNNNTSTNATFVCFAPYDDPQVALCLVVEKGSSGASLAALAAEILQYYFTSENTLFAASGENTLLR